MNDELIAGDTLDFLDSVPAYPPSDGWTLKYRLIPRFTSPAQASIDITATTSGSDYRVQSAAAVTKDWAAGFYTWSRWVEKAGPIRQSLGSGQLKVIADPSTQVAGYDSRSHPRKVLDAINAVLEARATTTQRELVGYTIGSRSQQFDQAETKATLLEFKSKYEWLVANEEARAAIASGMPNPRLIRVRFGAS